MIWELDASPPPPPTLEQQLFRFCSLGQDVKVEQLLDEVHSSGESVDLSRLVNGFSALHSAAKKGHARVVSILLRSDALLSEVRTEDGRTALMLAAYEGQIDVVQLLSSCQSQQDAVDALGNTALHYAAWGGNLACVRHLLSVWSHSIASQKNNEGIVAMQMAAAGNHAEVVAFLSEVGGAEALVAAEESTSDNGINSLHRAATYDAFETMELLLSKGMDVNGRTANGATPLHLCCQHGNERIARHLVTQSGALVNLQTDWGLTPLHYACIGNYTTLAKFLLEEGKADCLLHNAQGSTAMHLAAGSGAHEICRILAEEKNMDLFALDKDKKSPIDAALESGYKELAAKIAFWDTVSLRTSKLLAAADVRGEGGGRKRFKVLFAGMSHFESGFLNTREELLGEDLFLVEQCHRDDVEREIVDADVVVPLMSKITSSLIGKATRLKMIMQFGVGLEGVDVAAATAKNIRVCKIESDTCGNAQSCAEHAIYLALAVLRDQRGMTAALASGRLGHPTGKTLFGSSALIFGFGGLSRELLKRLRPFALKNIYVIKQSRLTPEDLATNALVLDGTIAAANIGTYEQDFALFARDVDVVFFCMSQTTSSIGMVDKSFLSHLKPGTTIVNISRGGLLNYVDVLAALQSGHLRGVGTDVFHTEPFPNPAEDAFLSHNSVISTPHVAGVTEISYRNMAKLVAENVRRLGRGEEVHGCVNNLK